MRIPLRIMNLTLVSLILWAASERPAAAQDGRRAEIFRDWILACDETESCRAIGLPEDGAAVGAFLRISRGGGAPDASIELHVAAPDQGGDPAGNEGSAPTVRVMRGGREIYRGDWRKGGLWFSTHFVVAPPYAESDAVFAALLAGERLEIESEGLSVSLLGATAALLRMDDRQGRLGAATALVDRGTLPWSAPTVPMISIPAPIERLTAVDPQPDPPGLPPFDVDPGCAMRPSFVADATDGTRIWGVCETAGNTNQLDLFWAERDGGVLPLAFPGPGRDGEAAALVANPVLEDDLAIASTALNRGLGDCGEFSRWLWAGGAPFLVTRAEMPLCRGVPVEAWPRLLDLPHQP